jgi:hypothetical protein
MLTSETDRSSLVEDLRAGIAARSELGEDYERALADSLVARVDAHLETRGPTLTREATTIAIALGSVGLGIVFALVAQNLGHVGGTVTTLAAWVGIVVINVAAARSPRR